jgi:hypothetical protein
MLSNIIGRALGGSIKALCLCEVSTAIPEANRFLDDYLLPASLETGSSFAVIAGHISHHHSKHLKPEEHTRINKELLSLDECMISLSKEKSSNSW